MIGRLRRAPLTRVVAAMDLNPARVALAAVTGTLTLASAIALMGVSGWLISRAAQQPPVLYLMVAVVTVRALGIGRGLLRYGERLVSHDVALRGVVTLRENVFAHLAGADPAVTARLRRGDLLARLGPDVDVAGDVVVRSVLPFSVALLTGGLSVLTESLILPSAGAVMALSLLLAGVIAPTLAGRSAAHALRDTAAARTRLGTEVLALLDGLPELAVAGLAGERIAGLNATEDDLSAGLDRAARPAAVGAGLGTAALSAGLLGCLVLGVQAVSAGHLAPVMLAVVILLPLAAAEVVTGLPAAAVVLVRADAAARRVSSLLVSPPARPDAPAAPPRDGDPGHRGAASRAVGPGRLAARGLACGYADRQPLLQNLDLEIPPGRHVAVVGPSGAGKSTLLRTLAGLLAPVAGGVVLDGAALTDAGVLGPLPLPSQLRLIADDAYIFSTTVRENLRLVEPGASDAALRAALERARLGEWLRELPAGLDTVVSDPAGPGGGAGGRPLSGGERRRLLLARGLLGHPRVLLVDEPAEHLDPETADALVHDLLTLEGTVLLVTHRLSPLAAADEVLIVDDGRIAARGRHQDLLAREPTYRTAWVEEQGARPVAIG